MNEELMKVVAEMRVRSASSHACDGGGGIGAPLVDSWADRLEALAATTRGTEVPEEVELGAIDTDEEMGRHYIPLPGGWEMQTKGNGSTFRLCDTKSGRRWIMWDNAGGEHKALEQMAREINAACRSKEKTK